MLLSINQLLQHSAFAPEQIDRVAAAYQQVLRALRLTHRIDPLTVIVAEKIFGIAETGEVDTDRIVKLTLREFQDALVEDTEPASNLNQRARELRWLATARLIDAEALAALGTALGKEVAAMIMRHRAQQAMGAILREGPPNRRITWREKPVGLDIISTRS